VDTTNPLNVKTPSILADQQNQQKAVHGGGLPLGRKSWLFCGSDRGGRRAAAMYSLIVSAKMNDVDPQAWLADVLSRIATHPAKWLAELLPWHWKAAQQQGIAVRAA
jgi:hypothetical protein